MGLEIQAFTEDQIFETLQGEWNDLLAHCLQSSIFLTWEWQSNWWAAYGKVGQLWLLAIRDEAGQLLGLAPWFIEEQATGRWVRSVGCVDVTDYLELILREGHEEAVLEALTAFVVAEQEKITGLSFCNIPAASPLIPRWRPILEAAGFHVEVRQQEVCPVIELPATVEEYFENVMNAKQAGEIRRKFRHAKTAEISWEFAEDNLEEALTRFLALMRASSPEKAQFLDNPTNLDFFWRVIPAVQACGWLKLSILQVGGKDAAAYLSFDYNNQIQLYNSGQDHSVASKLSPGILLLMYIIQDAIRAGRSHFDFLRGNEEYKYRAGGKDTAVMMLNATLK